MANGSVNKSGERDSDSQGAGDRDSGVKGGGGDESRYFIGCAAYQYVSNPCVTHCFCSPIASDTDESAYEKGNCDYEEKIISTNATKCDQNIYL